MTITERLLPLLSKPFTDFDLARARLLYLDWIGCATAGGVEPIGQKLRKSFNFPPGPCRRISAESTQVQMAAFYNGCLGNVLEMDDVDRRAVLHAAPTVIPAAKAVAEYVGADTKSFFEALIIGYEVTLRIGRSVGAGHYAFWHNTATCGPFGAAAAACHLIEDSNFISALGLAGTLSAGLWQTRHEPESDAKQIHAGHAAQLGVMAAMMSAHDIKGPREILEGEHGFFKAMCPGADPEDVLLEYDSQWLIHETSIKPYAACRHSHAAIDAALNATLEAGEIIIETYNDAIIFCDRSTPCAGRDAKFSLQHVVAFALQNGFPPSLGDFTQEALSKTRETRKRISVHAADEFNLAYPAHYGAAVTIGGIRHVAKDALGDPEKPLPDRAVFQKTMTLFAYAGLEKEHGLLMVKEIMGQDFVTEHGRVS